MCACMCVCGFRLVASVFRLCEVEKRAVEVKLGHLLSPEVGCTIMWFLRRWSLSYLLPIETYYSEVSLLSYFCFAGDGSSSKSRTVIGASVVLFSVTTGGTHSNCCSQRSN